ncbi:MAG: hypothetical protein ACOCUI_04755, partial [bacterium]
MLLIIIEISCFGKNIVKSFSVVKVNGFDFFVIGYYTYPDEIEPINKLEHINSIIYYSNKENNILYDSLGRINGF